MEGGGEFNGKKASASFEFLFMTQVGTEIQEIEKLVKF